MTPPSVTKIVVDLDRQRLRAYSGEQLALDVHCVTGRLGKDTHPGTFRIFRKETPYTSRTYNVPMNYAMFFTKDGKAIHESSFVTARSFLKYFGLSNVGSSGCVGLSQVDAKKLFEMTPIDTPVEVVRKTK